MTFANMLAKLKKMSFTLTIRILSSVWDGNSSEVELYLISGTVVGLLFYIFTSVICDVSTCGKK